MSMAKDSWDFDPLEKKYFIVIFQQRAKFKKQEQQ